MMRGRPLRICCYAFSTTALFFRALVEQCEASGDPVEWSVVFSHLPFRRTFDRLVPAERRLYLYRDFDAVYRRNPGPFAWPDSATGDSVYRILAKDKVSYRRLDKDEQLRRAAAIVAIYRGFLERVRPDYLLAPDVETVDGFLLLKLCKEMGVKLLYYVDLRLLGRGMFASDEDNRLPPYFGAYGAADAASAAELIASFRAGTARGAHLLHPPSAPPKPPFLRRAVVNTLLRWWYERRHATEQNWAMRVRTNLMPLVNRFRRKHFELASTRYFDRVGRADPLPGRFILYLLHVTPESSINGVAPYFVDQFRAIDLILQSMPGDCVLLAKEHPAAVGTRPRGFYRDLRRRAGLVLAHPDLDTRQLVEQALLVVTVTGTVGLECYLLDRPCLLLGPVFFEHLCCRLDRETRPLAQALREIVSGYRPPDPDTKIAEIAKLLDIGGDFLIGDPWFMPSVMAPSNIAAARQYLWRHLERLGENVAREPADATRRQAAGLGV